jgi:hypothetical protein
MFYNGDICYDRVVSVVRVLIKMSKPAFISFKQLPFQSYFAMSVVGFGNPLLMYHTDHVRLKSVDCDLGLM